MCRTGLILIGRLPFIASGDSSHTTHQRKSMFDCTTKTWARIACGVANIAAKVRKLPQLVLDEVFRPSGTPNTTGNSDTTDHRAGLACQLHFSEVNVGSPTLRGAFGTVAGARDARFRRGVRLDDICEI